MTEALKYRRISGPEDRAWSAFMRLYRQTFSEGQRERERAIADNLDRQDDRREGGHLLLMAEDVAGRCVGGAIFSYLPSINSGYISYLFVMAQLRSRGIGRRLLREIRRVLNEKSRRLGRFPVSAVFAELEKENARHEDTYRRLAFWARNGVRPLAVAWEYPPLHKGEPPVPMYLAVGLYGKPRGWLTRETIARAAQAIFDATYAYLPAAPATLRRIAASLHAVGPMDVIPYVDLAAVIGQSARGNARARSAPL